MVEIPTGLAINTPTAGDRTVPSAFRKIMATLFKQVTPGAPVAGIIAGPGTPLLVEGSAGGMEYVVRAGYAMTTRTNQGAYLVGTDQDVTVPTSAADSSNPRIDLIYIVQPDPELTEEGHARIDVVVGTPATTPAEPTGDLPAGALVLGKKRVDAGVANTSGTAIYGKAATTSLNVDWNSLSGKPSTFPPSAHTHPRSDISDASSVGRTWLGASSQQAQRELLGLYIQDTDPGVKPKGSVWIRKA